MNHIYDPVTGYLIDEETGLVIEEDNIDTGQEWRAFGPEDVARRVRAGGRVTHKVHDRGLTTVVGDKRLDKLNRYARVGRGDKLLVSMLAILNEVAPRLGLRSNVVETAALILRKVASKDIKLHGERLDKTRALVAIAIVGTCRALNIAVSLKRVADTVGVAKRSSLKWAMKKLYLEYGVFNELKKKNNTHMADPYIADVAGKVGAGDEAIVLAKRMLSTVLSSNPTAYGDSKPYCIAVALIYIASVLLDKRIPYTTLTNKGGVSDVCMRDKVRKTVENLEIEVMI